MCEEFEGSIGHGARLGLLGLPASVAKRMFPTGEVSRFHPAGVTGRRRRDETGRRGLACWLPLYVASERVSIWSGFVRAGACPAWARGYTFRSWPGQYVEALAALI